MPPNASPAPDTSIEPSGSSSLDFEQILYILREKAWLIMLCGLLGILAGLAYIHKTQLTYYAQSIIEVDPNPVKPVGYDDVGQPATDPISEEMGQTLIAEFRGRKFAQEVIEENDLLHVPAFIAAPVGTQVDMDGAVGALIGMEHVSLVPGTRFIDVGVTHGNPVMAKELADDLAKHYIETAEEQQASRRKQQIDYLHKQAIDASTALEDSAIALQDYIREKGEPSLQESRDTVVADLHSESNQLDSAHAEWIKLAADDDEVQGVKNNEAALLQIPSVANDPSIMADKQVINEIQQRIDAYTLRYTEKHPKLILARQQMAEAQSKMKSDALSIPTLIHSKRTSAETREQKFGEALKKQEDQAMTLDQDHIRYDVLNRDVQANQALYDGILSRIKSSQVATGMDTTGINIFETAQAPVEPMQARKSKTLALSLIGGLVAGLVLAFGLHMMDSSIKSVDQAEDVLGMTVLAAIPRQNQSRLKESTLALVKAPGSPVAEGFRSLRTSIYLAGKARGRKIVLFTSTLAGEGKTFCTVNYATSLAQQGLRTLLIDADLRSPMIGSVMLPGQKVTGLGELLSRKVDSATIHESEVENLWVLPAGDLLPNPAEMLARSDMGEIVKQLSEKFDRIVIDTAPITAVSDTLLLLEHAEAVCLVVHSGRTSRKWLMRALKLINDSGSRVIGVILNQMPMRMAGAYSYYPGKYGEPEVYGSVNGSYGRGQVLIEDSKPPIDIEPHE
jgi:polysaccharide biosynthesis transport protein